MLRIVSRDKILHFENTFISSRINYYRFKDLKNRKVMAIQQCLYPMPETKVSMCTVFTPFFLLIVTPVQMIYLLRAGMKSRWWLESLLTVA